jgi:L-rhamnose mutarotase
MPTFLVINRHSPESCPMHDEKMMKLMLEVDAEQTEIQKKHGVKRVGMWTDTPQHTMYIIYEAPTAEVFQRIFMEPKLRQWTGYTSSDIRMVLNYEEGAKLTAQLHAKK